MNVLCRLCGDIQTLYTRFAMNSKICVPTYIQIRVYAYMEQHVHEVASLGELPEREEVSTFVWNLADLY